MNSITTDEKLKPLRQNIHYFLKWTLISLVTGTVVGLVGTLFGHGIQLVTSFWKGPWLDAVPGCPLRVLPSCGCTGYPMRRKTRERIWSSSPFPPGEDVTAATAPLIFISTLLSHVVSASAGREGAALQLGGSLGNVIGKAIHLDEKDRKIAIMLR